MNSLTTAEKSYLEELLGMGSGYVLNLNNDMFASMFRSFGVDIYNNKYMDYGTSKAKRMRSFWEKESNITVAKVLRELLNLYLAECDIGKRKADMQLVSRYRNIVERLEGGKIRSSDQDMEKAFLESEFKKPDFSALPVDPRVSQIMSNRYREAELAMNTGAYLCAIIMCGSILEGVLLDVAISKREKFMESMRSSRNYGKIKEIERWNFSQLIDVACNVGELDINLMKFSHGLREFRNFIHPYQQLQSGFTPDEHTAKICFQVLKAALARISGK